VLRIRHIRLRTCFGASEFGWIWIPSTPTDSPAGIRRTGATAWPCAASGGEWRLDGNLRTLMLYVANSEGGLTECLLKLRTQESGIVRRGVIPCKCTDLLRESWSPISGTADRITNISPS
jgi:hypothetical protein